MQLLQRRAGVGAELVGQPHPDLLVAPQRLGLPAAAVQREEQLAGDPLVERVLVTERRELGQDARVLPAAEPDVDEVELGGQPLELRLAAQAHRPRRVEPREQGAAPAGQRLGQQRRRGRVVGAARTGGEAAEPVQVDRVLVDPDGVPAGPAVDLARQRRTEPGQITLQRLRGPQRRVVAPNPNGELVGRNLIVDIDQQRSEHIALPG